MIIKLFKSANSKIKKSKNSERQVKNSRFSVGLKMMLGIGLTSIFCMGLLVYINLQAFSQVGIETQSLLDINGAMNKDLRASIFDLQQKYLDIPKLLQVDAADEVKAWIKYNYKIDKAEIIEGSENYRKLFNRSQRRDISKGNFVVQQNEEILILSKGVLDKKGNFLDQISQTRIPTDNPAKDAQTISTFIKTAVGNAESGTALKQSLLSLKNLLADEAIEAEKSRNAILYKVDDIEKKKAALLESRKNKQQLIGLMAGLTILLNLVLLHFMAWFVVEKPLKQLTRSIDMVNQGEIILIPYQNRTDQIGVLAGAVKKFQDVLTHLRDEDSRKRKQKHLIQELIQQMSTFIETIQIKAKTMKANAIELSALATNTEDQTKTASESAYRTVEKTNSISYSTRQLQSAVKDISSQILKQNDLVGDINEVTCASRNDMEKLNQASSQINEIVNIVKNIAGQTKLLALNARIEAARSGEAGKGFKVVAREVRELSLQTEAANEDIANKIAAIQKASKTIIEYTQQTEKRIERLLLASHQISAAVEEQDTVTTGISENIDATANEIKDVSSRISNVNDAARATNQFAGSVEVYSEQIEMQLSDLLHKTRKKLAKAGLTETIGSPKDISDKITDDISDTLTDSELYQMSLPASSKGQIKRNQSAA
ncbi:MAG: hypothetical protein HOG03_18100 [Desulfobacula sp.]|jgi:methyl-accepting chemotaxis protein|uniref:methyl-accepting chemotaxis protein n=1 Tax=Desulfobacula sp. TaxID=2593537 RepID=UPI001ED30608|nr:hypothetical protein [Desulfobacula sp.]MBT4876307.1 hypothetical protein [Desulfobacula sp.]MBT5546479.1 hypothetical protein [Desulfobacula sp.]MBT5972706.1 hypothetical protein [Desulfobacula sp.]MBT7712554.1 hypothetical protein [Deltaproteobacteria bacterium]